MPHNRQKKAAVINDFTGFGRCSITVSLPILSAMGIQCCPLPTAIFSNHTAFPSWAWTDYTQHMAPYMKEWKKLGLHFQAISTGFLGSQAQIALVKDFFALFRTPETVVVVDPVLGDHGRLYAACTPALAEGMGELAACADLLTPNLTEACILAGRDYEPHPSEEALEALCRTLAARGPKRVVISGLDQGEALGNYVYQEGKPSCMVWEVKTGSPRCGTGDAFAAILTGDAVNGVDFSASVARASGFVARAIRRSDALRIPHTDGIAFEELLGDLVPPGSASRHSPSSLPDERTDCL